MRNKAIKQMAISAVLIAIIGIMTFVPYIGYISIGAISITTIHVVVLLAGILFGWKQGLVAGFAFGVWCLLKALLMPTAVTDTIFINPLLSVLPRAIFGLLAGLFFDLEKKISNIGVRSVMFVITSIVMTLIHSIMVLSLFYLLTTADQKETFGITQNYFLFVGGVFSINTLIETIGAGIIIPTIALAVSKAKPEYNAYAPIEKNVVKAEEIHKEDE